MSNKKSQGWDFALPLRPQVGKQGRSRGSGVVVLRLVPEIGIDDTEPGDQTLAKFAERRQLSGLKLAIEKYDVESRRLISAVPPAKLIDLEREAVRSEFFPLHSLTSYWRLDARQLERARVAELVAALSEVREIDAVWEQELPTPPVVTPGDDPYNAGQTYQNSAPLGIDARWMWTQPDGEGAGVGVIDVEGGWRATHEDLAGKAPTLIFGTENTGWVEHGTAVLGEIVAIDNTAGVVGTAPAVTSVRMASIFDAGLIANTADAIVAAAVAAPPGDVILIEVQLGFLPVETTDDCLDAIRLAVARGVIVVQAAGNGSTDLDTWVSAGGRRLDRTHAAFVDSGAIMVGASLSSVPHDRWTYSNYGNRIDCYAYGENVTTTSYGDLDNGGGNPNREYTDTFQGTSSASPIIVSAAALVQSRYKAIAGTALSPTQMRALLSDPATGTAQGAGVVGAIGVMPNLAAVVPGLGLVPDVYLRDAVGDVGAVPWTGAISVSPDVIVRPSAVADPQLSYGEGSGTENTDTLGSEVEAGQDNSVYVRVRNRGGSPALNVTATVYHSQVATLVTPSLWTLIGSVTIPSVPVGDVLTVSPELVWPRASVPASGHRCFVATLSQPNDPAPPTPGALANWNDFYAYIQDNNNVTWRNFNVVNNLPDPPDTTAFPFLVTGADDRALAFEFQIERRLPRDASLELEGPLALLKRLRGRNAWEILRTDSGKRARLRLPALPRIALGKIPLPEKARENCKFVLRSGKELIGWGHGVAVRQLYEGREVGRIGWVFAPEAHPCDDKQNNN